MTTTTLENRAYKDVKKRISSSSAEKFNEEMSSIQWRINSYSKLGGISNSQKTELLNMLFEKATEYSGMRKNENILNKRRIVKMFKSSQPYYSANYSTN